MDKQTDIRIECIPAGPVQANCYLLSIPGRDGCLMIDPGGDAGRLKQALKGRMLQAVFLTHGHFDHIGAVDALAGTETRVYIHPMDAGMLEDEAANASLFFGRPVRIAHPARLVEDGESVMEAGITIKVLHTPGHTPGGVCYQAGEHLFTGDTLFLGGFGRTDLPGGNGALLQKSLKRLMLLEGGRQVWPGHGPATTLEKEREFYK